MKIAIIKWVDAAYNSSSWDRNALKKDFNLIELITVGQLFEEKEDSYILASEYALSEDTFRHIVAVPKSCIKDISIIESDKDL